MPPSGAARASGSTSKAKGTSAASAGDKTPRSAKGERSRAALIRAARRVFARDGFVNARIADIAKTAKLAHGTFYTHFSSKEEILLEVLRAVHDEAFLSPARDEQRVTAARTEEAPLALIEATNRRFLDAYRRNAPVLGLLEQVATFNPSFSDLRRETRAAYIGRAARGIRRWQAAGVVDQTIEPECTAALLGAMVERYAYMAYVFDDGYRDEEVALATMTRIWAGALGLSPARELPPARPPTSWREG